MRSAETRDRMQRLVKDVQVVWLEGGGHIVNLGDGKRALHGAVAGNQNVVLDLARAHIVAVH